MPFSEVAILCGSVEREGVLCTEASNGVKVNQPSPKHTSSLNAFLTKLVAISSKYALVRDGQKYS